jgi:hypothetical protein
MIIDGVDFDELIKIMNTPIEIKEEVYQDWKEARVGEAVKPRSKPYLRGDDFQSYWKCARRLWYNCHIPKQKKSMINKSIHTCVVRHDLIEDILKEAGWSPEHQCKGEVVINDKKVFCTGHIDGYSPSHVILDIKHKWSPTDGDKLQTGFYQMLVKEEDSRIALLYPTQIQYYSDMRTMVKKYLPRVYACVALDYLPPRHPDFQNCFYNCEYWKECGRTRKPPKRVSNKNEWGDWFSKISSELNL